MPRILVADPEPDIIYCFERLFAQEPMDIIGVSKAEEAVKIVETKRPDLVLMEIRMPGSMDGLEALRRIKAARPKQLVIMMTAFGATQTAIEAMKLGAYDFLLKPFDVNKVKELVRDAIKAHHDMESVVSYQPLLRTEHYSEGIIGQAPSMQQVYKRIGQVAATPAPVLITGESGTGKELVARAIYHHSLRRKRPFLALNCAAIPEALLESELFGYEKGAFTGALNRKLGKLEQCEGGTLLLDEIGDMAPMTQTKLLRVLQQSTFERVGGTQTIKVNVRFLASTNRRLEELIRFGKFREDLFYRLNVVPIHLPPLRDRLEDIPLLTEYFLTKASAEKPERQISIAAGAIDRLQHYSWPGNVRELENVINNALLTAQGTTIMPSDLMIPSDQEEAVIPVAEDINPPTELTGNFSEDMDQLLDPVFELVARTRERGTAVKPFDEIERSLLVKALNATGGNQVRAAKLIGITRTTLRKRMEKYQVSIQSTVRLNQRGKS